MKKLFYLMLLLPILFIGCKKNNVQNEEPEAVKLSVEPNSIISPSAGADYTLTLTAPEAWTATCADSWVKVTPSSGNAGTVEISVKIAADKTSTEASSKIVFKSGGQTVEVPVKRLAKDQDALKIVSGNEIQTPKDGGVYSIQIESNIKWQIASNVSWAKIEGQAVKRNNATITVTVAPATIPEETVATLTVSPLEGTGIEKQTVTITRGGSDATSMTVDKSKIEAPAEGGTYTVTVTTTAKWRAIEPSGAYWITLSDNEQTGNGSFTVKVASTTSEEESNAVIMVEEVRSDFYKPVQLTVLVTREAYVAPTLEFPVFSVSDTKKVYFSKGNLQYHTADKKWRFAPEQFQICGMDNETRSNVWIDLFGYGTSGKGYGSKTINPDNTSTDITDYFPSAIEGTDYDWGVYLTEENKLPLDATTSRVQGTGKWRTLTTAEWSYLIVKRLTSTAFATINGQLGIILLPDDYQPSGVTLNYLTMNPSTATIYGQNTNLTLNEWRSLEMAGAVFLPCVGRRYGEEVLQLYNAYYWTSTAKSEYLADGQAQLLDTDTYQGTYYRIFSGSHAPRTWGCAVRLVQDVE